MQSGKPPRRKPAERRGSSGAPPPPSQPAPEPEVGRRSDPPTAPLRRATDGEQDTANPRASSQGLRLATLGILALAIALRLLDLGAQPLQPVEAEHAWESWSMIRGAGGTASAGPLLVYGNALVFLLFGASDATARLLPALAGSALVALPLLLERELGRVGSRVGMLLLAISPTLVYYSRHAEPAILAVGAALAFVAFGMRTARGGNSRAASATLTSFALLLTTGPLAYYAIAALVVYLVVRFAVYASAPAQGQPAGTLTRFWSELADGEIALGTRDGPAMLRRAGLVASATCLVVTTGFLTNLHGVQEGLIDGLEGWLATFAEPSGRPLLFYASVLAVYETPSLVFGLLGALRSASKRTVLAGFLTWWVLVGLVLGTIGAGKPPGLAAQLVPLALLAGSRAEALLAYLRERQFRVDLGWLAAGGTTLASALGIALNHLSSAQPLVPEAIVVLPLLLIAAGLIAAVQSFGSGRTVRLLLVYGLLASVLLCWRANVILNYAGEANPGELLARHAASADVRSLARDTGEVLDALAMDRRDRSVVLVSGLRQPILWYLRGLPGVAVEDSVASSPAVAIQRAEDKAPRGGYVGQRYRVWSSGDLAFGNWKEMWRWLAFREPPIPPSVADAVVYVRSSPRR